MIPTSGSDASSGTSATVVPKLPVTLDTKGRVRTSKEQRRLILREFERSGMSAPQFAKQTGLKYSTLAAWVQRHRRNKWRRSESGVRLLEATVAPEPLVQTLQVHLPGGARLEVCEASPLPLVAALIHALEKPC